MEMTWLVVSSLVSRHILLYPLNYSPFSTFAYPSLCILFSQFNSIPCTLSLYISIYLSVCISLTVYISLIKYPLTWRSITASTSLAQVAWEMTYAPKDPGPRLAATWIVFNVSRTKGLKPIISKKNRWEKKEVKEEERKRNRRRKKKKKEEEGGGGDLWME